MSASSTLIADMLTVYNAGPSTLTKAAAIAAAGPIMDYPGVTQIIMERFQECVELLGNTIPKGIIDVTSNSDDSTNRNLLIGISHALQGLSAPSTTLIADIKTVISNGPSTLTKAAAVAAAGPLMDYVGMCNQVLLKLEEAQQLLSAGTGSTQTVKGLISITSASDDSTNKTLLQNVELALA